MNAFYIKPLKHFSILIVYLYFLRNSGSIYPVPDTTTLPSTTTTYAPEDSDNDEGEEKAKITEVSSSSKEDKKKSLTAEMKGFLKIITKFTDMKSLSNDVQIAPRDFSIRAVS